MKERPILFSGPMVRAILEGRKSQTRRIGKIQSPEWTEIDCTSVGHQTKGEVILATYRAFPNGGSARWAICEFPYGMPGDRLWGRETWGISARSGDRFTVCYKADGERTELDKKVHFSDWESPEFKLADKMLGRKFAPSIHMPRWASRITLEIVSVRAERLNEISEADAIAEGCPIPTQSEGMHPPPQRQFQNLWESINGPDSWAANPWVWVIEFQRINP